MRGSLTFVVAVALAAGVGAEVRQSNYTADLKRDGTLAGSVVTPEGGIDHVINWTAVRAKETAQSIAGGWRARFTGPVAEQPKTFGEAVFDLKVDGKRLTGTAEMGDWPGLCPISEGVLDGDHFSFVATGRLWSSSGYPRITFDGTVRGDEMTLTLTWGYVGSDADGRKLKMEGKKIRIDR